MNQYKPSFVWIMAGLTLFGISEAQAGRNPGETDEVTTYSQCVQYIQTMNYPNLKNMPSFPVVFSGYSGRKFGVFLISQSKMFFYPAPSSAAKRVSSEDQDRMYGKNLGKNAAVYDSNFKIKDPTDGNEIAVDLEEIKGLTQSEGAAITKKMSGITKLNADTSYGTASVLDTKKLEINLADLPLAQTAGEVQSEEIRQRLSLYTQSLLGYDSTRFKSDRKEVAHWISKQASEKKARKGGAASAGANDDVFVSDDIQWNEKLRKELPLHCSFKNDADARQALGRQMAEIERLHSIAFPASHGSTSSGSSAGSIK